MIYSQNSSDAFNLSGNPVISGNLNGDTPCNLRLYQGSANIVDTLGSSANIGVTMQTPGVFTNSANTDYNVASKFTSDNAEYSVLKNADGQLYLGNHTHTWTYSASGDTITATCTGTGTCDITPKPTVTISAEGKTYDGTAVTATVTKSDNWTTENGLTGPGTIIYSPANSANAGTYTASVTVGTGTGAATAQVQFTISPKTVSAPTITLSPESYTYDGTAKKPTVTVADGTTTIDATEYTVSYSDNTNAGTATVTITDKDGGNYTVSGSKTFTINKASQSAPVVSSTNETIEGKADGTITGVTTAMEYKLSTTTVYTAVTGTTITGLAAGTYNVRYAEDANHEASPAADVVINTGSKLTVQFDADGGTPEPAAQQLTYGQKVTKPETDPTKTGYTFKFWSADRETEYDFSTELTANITLKAIYDVNKYKLYFDYAGGGSAEYNVEYGEKLTDYIPTISQEGYTFLGWDKEIPETMPANDLSFTAQWKINQYTITFNTNGGTEIAPITQDYGTAITAPAIPTRPGYHFTGWSPAIPETMPAYDLTVNAQWSSNTPIYVPTPVVTTEATTTTTTAEEEDITSETVDSDDDTTTTPVDDDTDDNTDGDDTTNSVDNDTDDDTDGDDTTNPADNDTDGDTDGDDTTNHVDNDSGDDTSGDDTTNPADNDADGDDTTNHVDNDTGDDTDGDDTTNPADNDSSNDTGSDDTTNPVDNDTGDDTSGDDTTNPVDNDTGDDTSGDDTTNPVDNDTGDDTGGDDTANPADNDTGDDTTAPIDSDNNIFEGVETLEEAKEIAVEKAMDMVHDCDGKEIHMIIERFREKIEDGSVQTIEELEDMFKELSYEVKVQKKVQSAIMNIQSDMDSFEKNMNYTPESLNFLKEKHTELIVKLENASSEEEAEMLIEQWKQSLSEIRVFRIENKEGTYFLMTSTNGIKSDASVSVQSCELSEKEKEMIAGYLAQNNYTVMTILDVTVRNYDEGGEYSVTIQLPPDAPVGGKYTVICIGENGETKYLDAKYNTDGTITFKTDRFSKMVIAGKQGIPIWYGIGAFLLVALISWFILLFGKRRKKEEEKEVLNYG
ncbi:MAG: InlB B-repeat-containing protein [Ruminiclostridium sp.]|nr:InlB B-repeat-containing protein [Ruminiclostridium sp.]